MGRKPGRGGTGAAATQSHAAAHSSDGMGMRRGPVAAEGQRCCGAAVRWQLRCLAQQERMGLMPELRRQAGLACSSESASPSRPQLHLQRQTCTQHFRHSASHCQPLAWNRRSPSLRAAGSTGGCAAPPPPPLAAAPPPPAFFFFCKEAGRHPGHIIGGAGPGGAHTDRRQKEQQANPTCGPPACLSLFLGAATGVPAQAGLLPLHFLAAVSRVGRVGLILLAALSRVLLMGWRLAGSLWLLPVDRHLVKCSGWRPPWCRTPSPAAPGAVALRSELTMLADLSNWPPQGRLAICVQKRQRGGGRRVAAGACAAGCERIGQ